jgi:hypothetical protein
MPLAVDQHVEKVCFVVWELGALSATITAQHELSSTEFQSTQLAHLQQITKRDAAYNKCSVAAALRKQNTHVHYAWNCCCIL